jgi:hypothetical protein
VAVRIPVKYSSYQLENKVEKLTHTGHVATHYMLAPVQNILDTTSYVILIAFPVQQQLRERVATVYGLGIPHQNR